jgi:hypothetical protein
MSNLTKVMVTRSGTYQPLPNHLTPLALLLGDALLSKLPTLHPCCLALRIASNDAKGDISLLIRSPSMAGWKRWGIYPDWGKIGNASFL